MFDQFHPRLRAGLIGAAAAALVLYLGFSVVAWDLHWPSPAGITDQKGLEGRMFGRLLWFLLTLVVGVMSAIGVNPE